MQKQDQVECVDDLWAGDVLLVGHREHHVQEIGHVGEFGIGVDEREAHRAAVGIGRDRSHLADQPGGLLVEFVFFS